MLMDVIEYNEWDIKNNRGDIARFMNTGYINPNVRPEIRAQIDCLYKDIAGEYIQIMFMKLDDKYDITSDKVKRWLKKLVIQYIEEG